MNTFLPFPSYADSAAALDRLRLGKQRLEVLQMLMAMLVPSREGWRNHPCTKLWRGYSNSLVHYGVCVCEEWRKRGYVDNLLPQIRAYEVRVRGFTLEESPRPRWTDDVRVHIMYRRRLITKDLRYYVWKFPTWAELPTLDQTDWGLINEANQPTTTATRTTGTRPAAPVARSAKGVS